MNQSERGIYTGQYVELPLEQSKRPVLPEGCDSRLIQTETNLYVLRQSKSNIKMRSIYDEYDGIGFINRFGGTLSLRSVEEQRQFIVHCRSFDLPVVSPVAITEEGIIFPFIKGKALSDVFGFCNQDILHALASENLKDIQRAHMLHVVYGDRWGPNDIVCLEGLQRIDMDLRIGGSYACEFELAQVLYHMVYWAKDKTRKSNVLEVVVGELSSFNTQYDIDILNGLLEGHIQYFIDTEYECLSAYQLVDLFT
ncbi:MAG TPA: hypothetical protein VJB63_01140 [Patescibacteria group bacterium]|nr:hypothetical protein [Patescibacteria group bacterium]